jgi:hypothetical protein
MNKTENRVLFQVFLLLHKKSDASGLGDLALTAFEFLNHDIN